MNNNNIQVQGKLGYLTGVRAFFVPLKSRKLQLLLWKTNLVEAGGQVSAVYDNDTTHIIVGTGYSSSIILEQLTNNNICMCPVESKLQPKVVSHFWLSTCFQKQRFEDEEGFYLYGETNRNVEQDSQSTYKPNQSFLTSVRKVFSEKLILHSLIRCKDSKTEAAKTRIAKSISLRQRIEDEDSHHLILSDWDS